MTVDSRRLEPKATEADQDAGTVCVCVAGVFTAQLAQQ